MTIAMSAGERKKQGKGIYKAAFAAAMNDKRVLLIPLVALVAQLVLVAVVTGLTAVAVIASGDDATAQIATPIAGVTMALAAGMIHIYSQALILAAADQHFAGSPIDFKAARDTVKDRIKPVLGFGLMNGTVGALLRALRENFFGNLIAGFFSFLAGLAWAVATYFALPSIIFDNHSPVSGIKNSVELLKQRWSGAARVNIIAGAFVFLAWLVILGLFIGGISIALFAVEYSTSESNINWTLTAVFATLGITLFLILALALLETTISGFAKAALYRYAKELPISGFEHVPLESAFVAKKKLVTK